MPAKMKSGNRVKSAIAACQSVSDDEIGQMHRSFA
jgi:hypothetical protein